MLSIYDELPIHQTPDTLDRPATSDQNAYERYYFGFFDKAGDRGIGLTITLHPNKGLVDAAFAVTAGPVHESLLITDRRPRDPREVRCGPLVMTLQEPMRSLRIELDDPQISASIEFVATSPAIEESRVTRLRSNRVVQDRSRYVQLGTVAGTVSSPLGTWQLAHEDWFAGRDHSWGIWDGPREHASEAKPPGPSFFWLIGSFDDEAVQAVTHVDADGRRYGDYAATCPTLDRGADVAGPGALQQARPVRGIDIRYREESWHFTDADLVLGAERGDDRIALESLCTVLPRSVGYAHPEWISGTVHPQLPRVVRDRWDLTQEDLSERTNHRALQFVRLVRDDGRHGYGVVDQCVSTAEAARTPRRTTT